MRALRRLTVAGGVFCAALPGVAHAQVTEIDVNPRQIQLAVGEQREVLATAYDARGNTILDAQFEWTSSDQTVVTVQKDPSVTGVAYLVGVTGGTATVGVKIGNKTASVAVTVSGTVGPVGTGQATVIEVDPPQIFLLPTEEVRLQPRFLKDDGSLAAPAAITWHSYNDAVASVTSDGRVIGVAPGNTLIEATAANVPARRLTAQVATTEWKFERPVISLSPTRSDTIHVVVPAQGNRRLNPRQLSWRPNNTNVVVVSPVGIATGVAAGQTDIVAIGFGQQSSVAVRVHRPVEFLAVKRPAFADTVFVPLGGTLQFQVEPQAADESPIPEAPILWEIGDTAVVGFDAAKQQAIGKRIGSTTIKVGTADPTAPTKTWTARVVATGLTLDVHKAGLTRGSRLQLHAFFADSAGNRLSAAAGVTWTSSDTAVATVDGQGMVIPAGFGATQVVAATPWGNADTVNVYVQGSALITSSRAGTYDIYSFDPDAPDTLAPLVTGPGQKLGARFSPDGTKLVYVSNRPGNFEIYLANGDGSDPQRLTTTTAGENAPAWSPDGKTIYYESDAGGNTNIWRMNADGTDQRQLTQSTSANEQNMQPAASPDGKTVAFMSTRAGSADIWLMNPDGSNQRNFDASPNTLESQPGWVGDTALTFLRQTRQGRDITSSVVVRMDFQRQKADLSPASLLVSEYAYSGSTNMLALVVGIPGPTGQIEPRLFLIPLVEGGTPREVPRASATDRLMAPAFKR